MTAIFSKIKTVLAGLVPLLTKLMGYLKPIATMGWKGVVLLLSPIWSPIVTWARNPLTLIMTGLLMVVAYGAGDLVRAVEGVHAVSNVTAEYKQKLIDQHKADLAHEAGVILKFQEELDAMAKSQDEPKPKTVSTPRKPIVAVKPTPKPVSLFGAVFGN